MPKITHKQQSKSTQFKNLAKVLLEFELTYLLGKNLTKTNLIRLKQKFKRIVKDNNNIQSNPNFKNMSNYNLN